MRRLLIAIATLAGFGVVVSSYGLWQHYAPLGQAFCNINESFSCDIVNKSAYSEIAGIPVALVGVIGYAMLAIVALWATRMMRMTHTDDVPARPKRLREGGDTQIAQSAYSHHLRDRFASSVLLLFAFSLLGLAFQAVYTVIEFRWIGAYCPICIASQVTIFAIAVLAFITYRNVHSFGRPSKTVYMTQHPMEKPLIGTLTCPHCDAKQQAEIPTSSCQHSYVCNACGKTIAAQPPDCCVFCSYGDRKCPIASSESVNQ